MHPKETLTKTLKWFFGDTRSAIVSYIVLALIAAGGGLLALSRTALNFAIQIMTTPTPLWATISLVLLVYLNRRIALRKHRPLTLPSVSDIQPANQDSGPQYTIALFEVGDYKWKTKIYRPDYFEVDKYPICIKHDLPLIWDDKMYKCPEADKNKCYNKFAYYNHEKIYDTAKSYIEKEIRNNPSLAPAKEKPLEPASASSAPGPDDYHAPRRRLPPRVW